MNAYSTRGRLTVLAVALVACAALTACDKQTASETNGASNASGTVTQANVAQKVVQAQTPQDHEAIAAYYEIRAREAERESTEDRDLQGLYEQRWQRDHHPMGSGARDHLDDLTESHESGARHYRAMATWHHDMARSAEHDSTARE